MEHAFLEVPLRADGQLDKRDICSANVDLKAIHVVYHWFDVFLDIWFCK
jgi:hypothetical protein